MKWYTENNCILKDPIQILSSDEKKTLFKCRYKFLQRPKALPTFLKAVNWANPFQISEAYYLLEKWRVMDPENAIYLVGDKF